MQSLVGKSIGTYRIIRFLGQKNQSSLYIAVDQKEEKKVVIRFYFPGDGFSESQRRHVLSAFETLHKIDHPSLVGIIGYNMAGRIPYLVMPYIASESLQQHCAKPLPLRGAVRLLLPIARALEYTHSHHLPHGSINARNILWTDNGLVLADLGHMRLVDLMKSTQVGPSNTPIDTHSDIRDLGKVLNAMVSACDPAEVFHADNLPEQVRRVIKKALSADPQQAYDSMADFAGELEGLVGIHPPKRMTPQRHTDSSEISGAGDRLRELKGRPSAWLLLFPVLLAALAFAFLMTKPFDFLWPQSDPTLPAQNLAAAAGAGTEIFLPAETPAETDVASGITAQNSQPAQPLQAIDLPSPTPEPTFGIGSVLVSPMDGMRLLYVPAGEFWMGSDDRDADEQPQHSVYLDSFWIDETEVTNAMYAACVAAGACSPPVTNASSTRDAYFGNPDFDTYPVVFVSWTQAGEYCAWAGRRLPSEAEWEKAARGDDGRICPWGNQAPDDLLLNYNMLYSDTTSVGSFTQGASPYAALDMAGNVWEWVSDWYDSRYYQDAPADNPSGPESGSRHVLRGGSWYYDLNYIRAAFRFSANASTTLNDVGFRCALTP